MVGFYLNLQADDMLRDLRKKKKVIQLDSKIVYGGLFEYVSAANLSAEILEWIGFASLFPF